jgi:hypothetical protein
MNPKIIRFSPAFLASRRPNSQIFSFGLLPLVGKTMPLSFLRALRRVASAPGIYGVVNPETFLYLWSYRKTQSLAPDIVLNPLGYTPSTSEVVSRLLKLLRFALVPANDELPHLCFWQWSASSLL